jgi:hypothetical protein
MNWHETISKYTYQNHSKSIKIINHFFGSYDIWNCSLKICQVPGTLWSATPPIWKHAFDAWRAVYLGLVSLAEISDWKNQRETWKTSCACVCRGATVIWWSLWFLPSPCMPCELLPPVFSNICLVLLLPEFYDRFKLQTRSLSSTSFNAIVIGCCDELLVRK